MTMWISEEYLAQHLSEVLDRVQRNGETFHVGSPGKTIATIAPVQEVRGVTVDEVIARVGDLHVPAGFADDLEAAQREQGMDELPHWPDEEAELDNPPYEPGSRSPADRL